LAKVAVVGDLHAGVHKGHPAFENALKKFIEFTLLPTLEKENIKHVIQLGDIVDRKPSISYVTMNKIRHDLVLPFMEADLELHILVGNHDIPFKHTLSPSAPNELFHGHPNVYVYDEPLEATIAGLKCVMLPWICKENYEQTFELLKSTKHRVAFGHLELSGFDMYKGFQCKDGMEPKIFQEFDLVCSGHFHQPSKNGIIQYCGAPLQYTWADANCPRGFWILDTESLDMRFIRNPYEMFTILQYDNGCEINRNLIFEKSVKVVVKNKPSQSLFDDFINQIEKYKPIDLRIIENAVAFDVDLIDIDDVDIEQYDELVTTYINETEISDPNINKKTLESILLNTYNEAIQI
jgi:DNA repair exonuclease SbcCD nuclease subunit